MHVPVTSPPRRRLVKRLASAPVFAFAVVAFAHDRVSLRSQATSQATAK